VGDSLFYGRGAGGDPTSSAVISDLVELAQALKTCDSDCWASAGSGVGLKPMDEVISRYYLRLMVEDRPGVLAEVALVLGRRKIGISSVIQPEGQEGDLVPLIIMVHDAGEREFKAAREEIEKLSVVRAPAVCLRVEDFV
jgi:homoserine dehydrogenase